MASDDERRPPPPRPGEEHKSQPARPGGARPIRPCPVCGRAADPGWRPFCSARCRQVDLGRWLAGDYVVPGEDGGTGSEEDPSG
jgi:uncharacterized protein